jgi:uncharacterized membrane protein YeaQ/YmgE (transglycosylase-associated protein family)
MFSRANAAIMMALPDGGTGTALPGSIETNLSTLLSWGVRVALVAGIAGVIFGAIKMIISKRNHEEFKGGDIVWAVVGSIVSLAATLIISTATGTS